MKLMLIGLQILFTIPVAIVLLSIVGSTNHEWYVYASIGIVAAMISGVYVKAFF